MPDPKRNAAIYYLEDGFNPPKGLNGRRMAGQSFLKGFFDHADVDEFIAMSNTKKRLDAFEQIAKKIRRIQAGQRLSKQRTTAITSNGRVVYPYAELS